MNFEEIVKGELIEAKYVLDKIINEPAMLNQISLAAKTIGDAVNKNKKIISCGNGGSHCDAMHFAEELTGRFRNDRKPIAAIAISDPSHITCVANDYGFDHIFSRYVEALGQKGDVLFGLTTSGNSPNILNAVQAALEREMEVIILTGKDGGKVSEMVDQCIVVPHLGYSDRIQEIHIKIIHILILLVEKIVR